MKKLYLFTLLAAISINLFCQVHWTKHPDNPVLVPEESGEWDAGMVVPNSVIDLGGIYFVLT